MVQNSFVFYKKMYHFPFILVISGIEVLIIIEHVIEHNILLCLSTMWIECQEHTFKCHSLSYRLYYLIPSVFRSPSLSALAYSQFCSSISGTEQGSNLDLPCAKHVLSQTIFLAQHFCGFFCLYSGHTFCYLGLLQGCCEENASSQRDQKIWVFSFLQQKRFLFQVYSWQCSRVAPNSALRKYSLGDLEDHIGCRGLILGMLGWPCAMQVPHLLQYHSSLAERSLYTFFTSVLKLCFCRKMKGPHSACW